MVELVVVGLQDGLGVASSVTRSSNTSVETAVTSIALGIGRLISLRGRSRARRVSEHASIWAARNVVKIPVRAVLER